MERITQETKLIQQRKPTTQDRDQNNAEVVFERKDPTGRIYTIYGCICYESWQQWGAPREILSDNVDDIERWRQTAN